MEEGSIFIEGNKNLMLTSYLSMILSLQTYDDVNIFIAEMKSGIGFPMIYDTQSGMDYLDWVEMYIRLPDTHLYQISSVETGSFIRIDPTSEETINLIDFFTYTVCSGIQCAFVDNVTLTKPLKGM